MLCPCGSDAHLADCCGRYLTGTAVPASAELLMRSRYMAFTQLNEAYLSRFLAGLRPRP